jgi:hypothetical protein
LAARDPAFFSPFPVPALGSSSGGTWSVISATRRFNPPVSFTNYTQHSSLIIILYFKVNGCVFLFNEDVWGENLRNTKLTTAKNSSNF